MNSKNIKYFTIIFILALSCTIEFRHIDTIPPHIMVVSPADGQVDISAHKTISVTFSESMNTATAESAFSVSDGVSPVDGTLSWSGVTMNFKPGSCLSHSTIYKMKVATSAKDTSGNALEDVFNSSFTTQHPNSAPPSVTAVSPGDLAIDVPVTTAISVTFSECMDRLSAQDAFLLSDGISPVGGTFSWLDDTMIFEPSSELPVLITYYVRVTTSAKDVSGSSMVGEFNSSFTAVLATAFPGTTNDTSGHRINGTVYGATPTADRFGNPNKAYSFNGTSNYIIAAADQLPTADRTVSLWFYTGEVAPSGMGLMGYGGTTDTCGKSWIELLNEFGTSNYRISCHCDVYPLAYHYTTVPENRWINWVVTTGAGGTQMFIDGVHVASNSTYINNTIVVGKDLTIGVIVSYTGNGTGANPNAAFFNGCLDDIRIYNRALSANEIPALYQEGTGPSAPSVPSDGLIGEWLFNNSP